MSADTVPGRVLGRRYRLDQPLRRGGMSDVYVARDPVLGRDVAVKVVDPGRLGADGVDRLLREAQRVAALSHPNIVTVHDAVRDGDTAAIVMELVDGGTAAELARSRPPWDRAVEVALAVASGLAAAHAAGLVHQDVKPSNVLLDRDGNVKVADFGIADHPDATATLTLRGSVNYVAPEQAQGLPTDARTDVYGLGCVLYELLAGRPPFADDGTDAVLVQHLQRDPEPPSRHHPDVPAPLDDVVLRMLAKQPRDRQPDMGHVVHDLTRVLGSGGSATRVLGVSSAGIPPTTIIHRGPAPATDRLRWWAAASLILGVLVAAAIASIVGDRTPILEEVAVPAAPGQVEAGTVTLDDDLDAEAELASSDLDEGIANIEDGARELRRLLVEGRSQGAVSTGAEADLDEIITEILQKHAEDKLKDVQSKIRDFDKKLRDFVKDHEVTLDWANQLEDVTRQLRELVS